MILVCARNLKPFIISELIMVRNGTVTQTANRFKGSGVVFNNKFPAPV